VHRNTAVLQGQNQNFFDHYCILLIPNYFTLSLYLIYIPATPAKK